MKTIELTDLLKAGVHFGHQVSRWHPKMRPFIFTSRAGIYIIDLEQTAQQLKRAQEFVRDRVAQGGSVLFVGTKRQAKPIIQEAAARLAMPYVVERWLGGTFTNFPTITKMTKRLGQLKEQRARGELEKYTKKEQLVFDDEIKRLDKMVGGIERMNRLPDVVFVVDVKQEKTAVREAQKVGLPIIAFVDTNVSPEGITYPIAANDDATKSIQIIIDAIAEAVDEGRVAAEARQSEQAQAAAAAIPVETPAEQAPAAEPVAAESQE